MPTARITATLEQHLALSDSYGELDRSLISPDPYIDGLIQGPVLHAELRWQMTAHRIETRSIQRTLAIQIELRFHEDENFLAWLKAEGFLWEGEEFRLRTFLTTFLYDFESLDLHHRNHDFDWTASGELALARGRKLIPSAEIKVSFPLPID